jgi:hypothetical protein
MMGARFPKALAAAANYNHKFRRRSPVAESAANLTPFGRASADPVG